MTEWAIKIGAGEQPEITPFHPMYVDTLLLLQEAVGGYIECVCTVINGVDVDMWVNEEGLLMHLPINKLATQVHETRVGNENALIVGDVIITGCSDSQGKTLPLSTEETTTVVEWLLKKSTEDFASPSLFLEGIK